MPLILKKHIKPEGVLGVWRIEEDISYFIKEMVLDKDEETFVERQKGKRKIEWLASRYLLHLLSERSMRGKLVKDEYGKPHLEGSSYQISLSHSRDMVAVIASPKKVGIDIQTHVEKISRIAHKFSNTEELKHISSNDYIESLHVIWGAKESMYKAYGRKGVDFKKHMSVSCFDFSILQPLRMKGNFKKEDEVINFALHFEMIKKHYLVYGIEI